MTKLQSLDSLFFMIFQPDQDQDEDQERGEEKSLSGRVPWSQKTKYLTSWTHLCLFVNFLGR